VAAHAQIAPATEGGTASDASNALKIAPPLVSPTKPIIDDKEFEEAIPRLDDAPLESIDEWQSAQEARDNDAAEKRKSNTPNPAIQAAQDGDAVELLPDPPIVDPLLDDPLPSIDSFDAEPPPEPTQAAEQEARAVQYNVRIEGLDASKTANVAENADAVIVDVDAWRAILESFNDLSALEDGKGRAINRAEIGQRARADRQLLLDILQGQGFFDAEVIIAAEPPAVEGDPFVVALRVVPGRRYYLGQIAFSASAVQPPDLMAKSFVPKSGDPIVADIILAAEANITVALPQNGYPFAKVGQRDILLDSDTSLGDYTLPVETGARSYFGEVLTEGNTAFDADHVAILRRFKTGDLYDSRKVDDLRAALVATGLLSTVSVEPIAGAAPDGTSYADLLVRQEAAPPRSLAASAGYGTGQGFRAEASWTHRNLFPPEGSLTVAGALGTQEQAASVSFARANAGRRDRNIELTLAALHSNYDAFEAYTGRLAGTMAFVSTPIWQKKFTWSIGAEILATSEDRFDLTRGLRDRRIYYIGALPGQLGFDRSDDLLDPTQGYRVNLRFSPEASLGSGNQIYARAILDGSYYYPVNDSIVVAARARVGTISGIVRGRQQRCCH